MRQLMLKLWKDDGGALIAVEWVFVATILVIGVTVGLVSVRNAVTSELMEFGNAVTSLQQCYSFDGLSSCSASVCGSATTDSPASIRTISNVTPNATAIDVTPCP